MSRICVNCRCDRPRGAYTNNQWSKGDGNSRCASCVHGHDFDHPEPAPSDSGRYNQSSRATTSSSALANPFAAGAFRWVAKGKYVNGPRRGQPCVIKWFKTGAVFSIDFFRLDIKAVDKALELVNRFNQLNIVAKTIKINVPDVWKFAAYCTGGWAGQHSLVEPFITNYQKFNSNSGWNDTTIQWAQVMQALSHFSYHISGGNYVLCDLQGGIYQSEVVLSDPVIISRTRQYGVTDLGSKGIESFFSHHTCTPYCRPNWTQPANPVRHFRAVPGTSMMRHTVGTLASRPHRPTYFAPPTLVEEEEEDY